MDNKKFNQEIKKLVENNELKNVVVISIKENKKEIIQPKKQNQCKQCKGKMKAIFLTKYKEKGITTKAFLKECENCGSNYIYFIKKDKDGNKGYSRTFA